jgi:hypothetical protein
MQSRRHSAAEAATNIAVGYAVSLVAQVLIFPVSCSNRHQKYICGREHVVYYPDLYYFWRRW